MLPIAGNGRLSTVWCVRGGGVPVLRRAGALLRIGLASFDATSETRDF